MNGKLNKKVDKLASIILASSLMCSLSFAQSKTVDLDFIAGPWKFKDGVCLSGAAADWSQGDGALKTAEILFAQDKTWAIIANAGETKIRQSGHYDLNMGVMNMTVSSTCYGTEESRKCSHETSQFTSLATTQNDEYWMVFSQGDVATLCPSGDVVIYKFTRSKLTPTK